MEGQELREAFTGYFAARDHLVVPSSSLIPEHPRAPLFTNAGMNQFIAYFTGEEKAPYSRAVSVQRCVRIRGKHDDIDLIGRTGRHLTFFEMLGNFSFGDYFKAGAITYAWELLTSVLGLDPSRLWATVHPEDDEAVTHWTEEVGLDRARVQASEENFWEMGETGPCGPSSELFYDRGPDYGADGGPVGGDEERFVEVWNLVFMQYDRQEDRSLQPLPRPNIDTGAGLERLQSILAGVPTVWETDGLRRVIARAEELTGRPYGADPETDVALRVLADHGRCMTALVADGVLPSNENRGYVLRRIIRRAVLAARRLGVEAPVTPELSAAALEVMGPAWPALAAQADLVRAVLAREEAGFDKTLRTGLTLLDEALAEARAAGRDTVDGPAAFRLHDTHGFPIELTEELAGEAGLGVDRAGFEAAMAEQRARARAAARTPAAADESAYRELLDTAGPTDFVGRDPTAYATVAQVVGVLAGSEPGTAEIFLDRTPFYAEGGGQVGDTGTIVTETGRAEVTDTVVAVPGLTAHRARVEGEIFGGQDALATIEGPRREALRRNHTGTHLLHAALRDVLGDHVRQQGSLVAPDRLRFDFSHPQPVAPEELLAVVDRANADVLGDDAVDTVETSKTEAEAMGALAFFKDKYEGKVRVVRAGPHSLEFCGGTHVGRLGQIGPIAIVSEGSIGASTRRLEAVTGAATLARTRRQEAALAEAAQLLRTEPEGVVEALGRLLDRQRSAEKELARLRQGAVEGEAAELAAGARDGVVLARRDGRSPDDLRSLAQAVRRRDGVRAVVLGGSPDGAKAALAAATGGEPDATALVRAVASHIGGGGGGSPEVALAGGRDPGGLDAALEEAGRQLAGR